MASFSASTALTQVKSLQEAMTAQLSSGKTESVSKLFSSQRQYGLSRTTNGAISSLALKTKRSEHSQEIWIVKILRVQTSLSTKKSAKQRLKVESKSICLRYQTSSLRLRERFLANLMDMCKFSKKTE